MNFFSIPFFLSIIILLVFLKFLPTNKWRRIVLLAVSYVFYAYFDWRFPFILFVQTLIAFYSARMIRKSAFCLPTGIIAEIGILIVLKYVSFFQDSLIQFGFIATANELSWIVPVGISFYTLEAIGYMIDVKREKVNAQSLLDVALYLSFFATVTSGPIVKSYDFFGQLEHLGIVENTNLAYGGRLFLRGALKKALLGDYLAVAVNAVYEAPTQYSWYSIGLVIVFYSLEIYYDFSGYSDMAIGVAKMVGVEIDNNFNYPYLSQNPSEFWGRWHISLSSWFKEYLYIPLGGNRKGFQRTCINLLIVMLVSGFWHGAAWTFVLWGLLHGAGIIVNKTWKKSVGATLIKGNPILSVCINFIFVSFCWVVFRAPSLSIASEMLTGLFTLQNGIRYIYVYGVAITVGFVCSHIYAYKYRGKTDRLSSFKSDSIISWTILWLEIMAVFAFYYIGGTQFIYSQF